MTVTKLQKQGMKYAVNSDVLNRILNINESFSLSFTQSFSQLVAQLVSYFEIPTEFKDWMELAQDRQKWRKLARGLTDSSEE